MGHLLSRMVFAVALLTTGHDLWARDATAVTQGEGPQAPRQPQLAVESNGTIDLVFGTGDSVRYCRSQDHGVTFTNPVEVATIPNMSLGMRRGPRIAVTDSTICVTAI